MIPRDSPLRTGIAVGVAAVVGIAAVVGSTSRDMGWRTTTKVFLAGVPGNREDGNNPADGTVGGAV